MKKKEIFTLIVIILFFISYVFFSGCIENNDNKKNNGYTGPLINGSFLDISLKINDLKTDYESINQNYNANITLEEYGPLKDMRIYESYTESFDDLDSDKEFTQVFLRLKNLDKCQEAYTKFISYLNEYIVDKTIDMDKLGDESFLGENISLYNKTSSIHYYALVFRIQDVIVIVSGFFDSVDEIKTYSLKVEENITNL
jgi:hypothetical protein